MDANAALLREAFEAAIEAVRPRRWLAPALTGLPERVRVIAVGKAAVAMAQVFREVRGAPLEGLLVTPRGQGETVDGFRTLEAAHPVPDEGSALAGEAMLELAGRSGPQDLVLLLLSGGASALACAPIPGVSLRTKAEVTRRLLAAGVGIEELNLVRRALSRLKGGGLVRASGGARVVTLAQSDVPFDDLHVVGSGPGAPQAVDADRALALLEPEHRAAVEAPLRAHAASLQTPAGGWEAHVLCPMRQAPAAAAARLAEAGWAVEEPEEWAVPAEVAARGHVERQERKQVPAMVTFGETTVAVPPGATGRGGRNQHFLLALAIAYAGRRGVWALAADTDGVDGTSDAAGAWIDPALLDGLDVEEARAALAACDAHGFFERHGRLLRTGPTGVNVGDLRLLLVEPSPRA